MRIIKCHSVWVQELQLVEVQFDSKLVAAEVNSIRRELTPQLKIDLYETHEVLTEAPPWKQTVMMLPGGTPFEPWHDMRGEPMVYWRTIFGHGLTTHIFVADSFIYR